MKLQEKTLEKLRNLINEETEYRSGPNLISFFNQLGFKDKYYQGFPSRWIYTDEKLKEINGTPEIDQCIKKLFSPINFVNRIKELDKFINDFNSYLSFDKWKVVRKDAEILLEKAETIVIEDFTIDNEEKAKEDEFLIQEFKDISLEKLDLEELIVGILKNRLEEIKKCLDTNAPLAVIFLCGSTLEGILLGIASRSPQKFNIAKSAPKDKDGKVKKFQDWTLNNLINVSYEIGFLKEDVKKFSHSLRDFRNYIHPFEQLSSNFAPDKHTAKISWQVLKAVIYQLGNKK
ncbi:MAG: hypothetical protein DWQ06_10125 [Calditrichaeota bacterium]|nr:MAG: hypothetical protein DWQ06_10125 [Calditrichota bacterium]